MLHFIYLTTNTVNGKKYIGKHYGHPDDGYLGSGTLLRQAIKKYGKENFRREIVKIADDAESLDELEVLYIEKFVATDSDDFYNIATGGTGGNTLRCLPKENLEIRSNKIKQHFRSMSDADKARLSIKRSENMRLVRKDKKAELQRIANFKKSHGAKSQEEVELQYKSRSGGNSYCAKKVITPLGKFDCAKNAADKHCVHLQTVLNRCKNENFPDWGFADERHVKVHDTTIAGLQG